MHVQYIVGLSSFQEQLCVGRSEGLHELPLNLCRRCESSLLMEEGLDVASIFGGTFEEGEVNAGV